MVALYDRLVGIQPSPVVQLNRAVAGASLGLAVVRVAGSYFGDLKMPGAWPVIVSAFVLLGAAVVASTLPATRAARVDVMPSHAGTAL